MCHVAIKKKTVTASHVVQGLKAYGKDLYGYGN